MSIIEPIGVITQRPTAKQLLKHKFVTKTKKASYLIDLIERYRKWKENGGKASESEDDSDDEKYARVAFVSTIC